MVKAALVGLEIEAGSRIVAALDEAGLHIKVALWMTTPEDEDGRLVLASPEFDRLNLLQAYETVARTLHDNSVNDRPPLLILKMRDPFIQKLRRIFPAPKSFAIPMRLGSRTIGNRFIDDAYLYRI